MIDYKKLQIAHELAEQFAQKTGDKISIEIYYDKECYRLMLNASDAELTAYNIDDLIVKLKEISHCPPVPKYEVGQIIYRLNMFSNAIHEHFVTEIQFLSGEVYYVLNYAGREKEEDLYPSMNAAILAQIEYWTLLL